MPKRKLEPAPVAGARKSWSHQVGNVVGGGYARWDVRRGCWSYYLYKKGEIEKSTGETTEEGARRHLVAWLANPAKYDPESLRLAAENEGPVYLTDQLIEQFSKQNAAPEDEEGRGNSPAHVLRMRRSLEWWREKIKGRNLRAARASELATICPLDGSACGDPRIKRLAVKSLFTWLRETERLASDEGDLSGLKLPPSKSAFKLTGVTDKKAALEAVLKSSRARKGKDAITGWKAIRDVIEPHWRCVLDVLGGTGWHVTEFQRFVECGYQIEEMPEERKDEGAAILWTVHKRGVPHPAIVSEEVLRAALAFKEWNEQRVGREVSAVVRSRNADGSPGTLFVPVKRKRGAFPYQHFITHLAKLVKRTEGAPDGFRAGQVRHAVTTNAAGSASLKDIAEFVGHTSTEMLTGHYIDPSQQASKPEAQVAQVIELPRKIRTLV